VCRAVELDAMGDTAGPPRKSAPRAWFEGGGGHDGHADGAGPAVTPAVVNIQNSIEPTTTTMTTTAAAAAAAATTARTGGVPMVDDLDSDAPLTLQQQQFKARAGFGCGLASGVIQAAVFNPYDRALYLTVSE
jgi:hypothetical protein